VAVSKCGSPKVGGLAVWQCGGPVRGFRDKG